MKILIAPDKFKGTLAAVEVAQAIARGWRRGRPQDVLELQPISDGGDGFGSLLGEITGARRVVCHTVDAAQRDCRAVWWWHASQRIAIIESAEVIGLAKLPRGRFHPFELDTRGLAKVFQAAWRKGAKKIIVGIGGSATNDGGFGLARELGWSFVDAQGERISRWTELKNLARLSRPPKFPACEIVVAVDVANPLLGPRGATRVYGPQKGLRVGDFPEAEANLRQLARCRGSGFAKRPGAGAAGGLGFGLAAFLGAKLVSGFDLFAMHGGIEARLRKVDLVITGEGSFDRSSRMGKGVGQLLGRCARLRLPGMAFVGSAGVGERGRRESAELHVMMEHFSQADCFDNPRRCLEILAARVSRNWPETSV